MILTLILLSIGALLFLVIAYNVVQQYKQKAESDKRQAIARHKAVADETEEVLLNVNLVPFSKTWCCCCNTGSWMPTAPSRW